MDKRKIELKIKELEDTLKKLTYKPKRRKIPTILGWTVKRRWVYKTKKCAYLLCSQLWGVLYIGQGLKLDEIIARMKERVLERCKTMQINRTQLDDVLLSFPLSNVDDSITINNMLPNEFGGMPIKTTEHIEFLQWLYDNKHPAFLIKEGEKLIIKTNDYYKEFAWYWGWWKNQNIPKQGELDAIVKADLEDIQKGRL